MVRTPTHGADTSASRSLGLGLFIVKEIVSAHGGDIRVRSSKQHGTTFAVRLPRRFVRMREHETDSGAHR
jgi:signal transduction histidine kinase